VEEMGFKPSHFRIERVFPFSLIERFFIMERLEFPIFLFFPFAIKFIIFIEFFEFLAKHLCSLGERGVEGGIREY
jgi:hypothetical protein